MVDTTVFLQFENKLKDVTSQVLQGQQQLLAWISKIWNSSVEYFRQVQEKGVDTDWEYTSTERLEEVWKNTFTEVQLYKKKPATLVKAETFYSKKLFYISKCIHQASKKKHFSQALFCFLICKSENLRENYSYSYPLHTFMSRIKNVTKTAANSFSLVLSRLLSY